MTVASTHAAALKAAMQMPIDILSVIELWRAGQLSRENARITAEHMTARLKLIDAFVFEVASLPGADWKQP